MKKKYILLIFIVTLNLAFGVDYTTELYLNSMYTEKINLGSSVGGKVILDYSEIENMQLQMECNLKDEKFKLDLAKVKFMMGQIDLEVGKNRIGWGTGYNFNPTDIFNQKPVGASFDPAFVKKGRNSIIMTNYLNETTNIQVVYGFKNNETEVSEYGEKNIAKKEDYGIRIKKIIGDYDVSISAIEKGTENITLSGFGIKNKSDKILGADISGSLPILDWGIWSEIAYSKNKESIKWITGIDSYFAEDYYINVEYYYNGNGDSKKENYINNDDLYLGNPVSKNYLTPSLKYSVNTKLEITGYSFLNMDDKSLILGGLGTYLLNDFVEIDIMPFLLIGDDDTEYGIQKKEIGDYGMNLNMKIVF
ncbi:MAG: hypothetical protein B6I28_02845 [Fusobacteriia bacterium 4572_132]|nr:MAG: hypothetical protein B6I28_02845 [Fusobacteriia bacterium 4572_132]